MNEKRIKIKCPSYMKTTEELKSLMLMINAIFT